MIQLKERVLLISTKNKQNTQHYRVLKTNSTLHTDAKTRPVHYAICNMHAICKCIALHLMYNYTLACNIA